MRRGLYKTSFGHLINADCNGAANIAKKVATQLGIDLTKVGRGALTLPHRHDLFKSLSRSYRTSCEVARFQPATSQPCRILRASAGGDVNSMDNPIGKNSKSPTLIRSRL